MFERILALADLHVTSKAEDSYRWDLFPWIHEQVEKHDITDVILSGDITDFKENHPSELVNMLVEALYDLSLDVTVHWLMGNHDYLRDGSPYFKFIDIMDNINYYHEPFVHSRSGIALLPYSKTPEETWKDLKLDKIKHLFMHQPVIGSVASDFHEIQHGLNSKYFSENHPEFKGKVWSGDIHIPQVVGDVEYIGAPYDIKHGDKVKGRAIYIDDKGKEKDLKVRSIRKLSVRIEKVSDLDELKLKEGDQLVIKVLMNGYTQENWHAIKQDVEAYLTDKKCVNNGILLDPKSVRYESREGAEQAVEDIKEDAKETDVLSAYTGREALDDNLKETATLLIENAWRSPMEARMKAYKEKRSEVWK